jgi:hypothetical protein
VHMTYRQLRHCAIAPLIVRKRLKTSIIELQAPEARYVLTELGLCLLAQ